MNEQVALGGGGRGCGGRTISAALAFDTRCKLKIDRAGCYLKRERIPGFKAKQHTSRRPSRLDVPGQQ